MNPQSVIRNPKSEIGHRPAVFLDRDDTILDTTAATAHTPHPGDLVDVALVRLIPGAAAAIRRLNDAGLPVIVVSNQGAIARGTPLPLPEGGGGGKGVEQPSPDRPLTVQRSRTMREPVGSDAGDEGDRGDGGDGRERGAPAQTPGPVSSLPPLLHHPLTSIKPRPFTLADLAQINQRMLDLLHAEAGGRIDAIYSCPYHPKGTVPPFNTEHPWRKPAPGMLLAAAHDHNLDLSRSWMIGDSPRDIAAAVAAGIPTDQALLVSPDHKVHPSFERTVMAILSTC